MQKILELLNQNILWIVLGLALLSIILIIITIVNIVRLSKVQAKYKKFMTKEDIDLENLLIQYTNRLNKIIETQRDIDKRMKKIEEIQELCVQKVGVVRYNAISNTGADLSFAIALLDKNNDGVVLNGIYSRDGSYTYAKPIENGKSKYNLSDEEKEALTMAISKTIEK